MFAKALKAVDLIDAMSNHSSLTPEDVGRQYAFIGEPTKISDGHWDFPMFCIELGMHTTVSSYKLNNTELKGSPKVNWYNSSRRDGTIRVMKFVEFRDTMAGKNYVLPKYVYDTSLIGKEFKLTSAEVDDILWADWQEQESADRTKRRKMLRWARKTKYADAMLPEYLNKDKEPNEEAMKFRSGILVFEAIERES